MKKFYTMLTGLFPAVLSVMGQSYILPEEGHKVAYFFSEIDNIQALDVGADYFYFSTGDTIYQVDPVQQAFSNKYVKPADYDLLTFPGFLCLSSDESTLWTGYTDLDNADARIYSIDIGSGTWHLEARMPANFDMAFWNDSILVSGLNSANYLDPSAIYLLDTSGSNQHRKIIETGGSSAGLAVDSHGDLYYGTSSFTEPNALYRWDSAQLALVIETPAASPLQLTDAVKLSALPTAAYDCEMDAGGNLVFTMNTWGGTQVIARWNQVKGVGFNYDTLATSTEWLGLIKSRGDYTIPTMGNSLFTLGYGKPVADLHTVDYPPLLIEPLPVLSGYESEILGAIDLKKHIIDLDDPDGFDSVSIYLSESSVASVSVENDTLRGVFGTAGQSNLFVVASSAGKEVRTETVIGTWPEAEEGLLQSDFGELRLDEESYWNGSDETGAFMSGPARFYNMYNTEYFSWSGWAYSNTSDTGTAGFMNQYSAFTGEGFHGSEPYNEVYGVSNLYGPSIIDFADGRAHVLKGFFVTNSTYAALSMMQGDMFAKKFGGADGSDPDYFKLLVWGKLHGEVTDTVEFYLADYRFEDADKDYIIKTWQWVDLSLIGTADSLIFALESSDTGDWGMNTPAYFCIDNLMTSLDYHSIIKEDVFTEIKLYPNPTLGQFIIASEPGEVMDVTLYSIAGSMIYSNKQFVSGETVDLSGQAAGIYIVRILHEKSISSTRILIH